MKSIQKHGRGIVTSKFLYGALLAVKAGVTSVQTLIVAGGALMSGQPLTPAHTQILMSDAADLTRMYQGFKRFNKLAKGEWAIVTTPPKEAVEEKKSLKDRGFVPA